MGTEYDFRLSPREKKILLILETHHLITVGTKSLIQKINQLPFLAGSGVNIQNLGKKPYIHHNLQSYTNQDYMQDLILLLQSSGRSRHLHRAYGCNASPRDPDSSESEG